MVDLEPTVIDELLMNVLISDEDENQDTYIWRGASEIFDTVTIASQQTVETLTNGSTLNFTSNCNLPFINSLSAIYQCIIDTLQSFNTNSDNSDVLYPWNLIYPQTEETRLPNVSENGLYFIKLYFCGEWRAVLIDENFQPLMTN